MRTHWFLTLSKSVMLVLLLLSVHTPGLAQAPAIDLIVHYVDPLPAQDGVSHTVSVFLTVLDSTGEPVRNLPKESFSLLEDGQKVEIQNAVMVTQEPENIALVMDTSGSMAGTGITDAKLAAVNFVTGLKPNDQVAILTFDNQVIPRLDFTVDHNLAIERINAITTTPKSGTCLYDAAFIAARMFSSAPPGSRAVILFTDGRDETANGAICSQNTIDQVIAIASDGQYRTPIYAVGLGVEKQIDTKTLKHFAEQTGGYYLYSSSSSKLARIFQVLSNQLSAQYILTYRSTAGPGSHALTAGINTADATLPQDSDTRKFPLEVLVPHLAFNAPVDGETIHDRLKIAVSLSSQGQALIERVAFEVNGLEAGSDDISPYEIELDITSYPPGVMTITAIAYGTDNTILARNSMNVIHAEANVGSTPVDIPTAEILPQPSTPAPEETDRSMILISIVLSLLSIVTIGLLIYYLLRQQKLAKMQPEDIYEGNDTLPPMQGIPVYRSPAQEVRKPVAVQFDSDIFGALTVQASDDTSLIGQRFEITAPLVTLGRSMDNDFNFPNDKPISRHHAEIYQIKGKLYLREVQSADASGTAKPPKYGTLLNGSPMGGDPALLKTGDVIQLGKRVRLTFESFTRDQDAEALTYDEDSLTDHDVDETAVPD
jgi:VWFA-related protein